eukprot:s33_g35.t2
MLTHPEKAQPAHDAAFVLKEWTLAFSICHVDAKLSCLGGQRVLEVPMEGALPQLRGTEVPRRNSIPKNKAPKSQDGHTVRLLHQKEGEKGDVLGYLGLKVALSVPDRERLDWELIILDASRATQLGPSHVKLRRGDRILRVEEVSELREMIASLAALDTRGAEEPEEVELLVDLRTLREADKALESALPLSCKGFNLNPEFPDCGSEASLLGLPSYTEKSQSLVTFEGTDQLMMTRLRRVIRDLNVQEASQVVEKLTKRPQPSLLAFSPADAAADAVEFEVERLSETLLGAAGLSGSGGGGRDLWNALVAGSRGALAEAVDEAGATEDFAMPLDGLWLEALYNVGAIALELRREEIQFYTDAWCTRTIEMDWHRQLDEIDETLGWVSQQVEHLKAKAQQVLVMRRLEVAVVAAVAAFAAANPGTCVATKCAGALARCLADSVGRPWMIRCGDLYKPTDGSASKIDEFSECSISEHHCVPQQKLTCSIPRNAKGRLELNTLTGTWYVTRGWNPMFDCFDCQVHYFSLQKGAKPLLGDLKYAVKKDLSCTAPNCDYLPREEMHYMDDWYVLASRPNVYALIYYCGCNDACCGYAGAVLYTRSPRFEDLSTQDVEEIKGAIRSAEVHGFDFEGGSESLTVQQSFPPPSVLSLRWAMLKKPARDMVRELHRMRPRQKAKLALPADLKTGVKKVQHRHVGEAKPVEADGSCSHHLLVRDGNSSDCILPQRIDVGKHFIMTGGPEAIREPYEDMISRVSSFGRYLFDLKELPVVEKLFENPKFLHFAKSVCPKEKQVLD